MATLHTEFVEGMPGVTTTIVQKADFGSLMPDQLKRLVNACERGRIPYAGYVSYLVCLAAKRIGVLPPVKASPNRWGHSIGFYNLPKEVTQEMFADLMTASSVRQELSDATTGRATGRYYSRPQAQFYRYSGGCRLDLPGWKTDFQRCCREVMKIVNDRVPSYRQDMAKLKAFIASKPVFTYEDTRQ